MPKLYTSLAIDHGTTNSAIATMENDRPRVIRPNGVDDVMPSAVYIDKRGRTLIGSPAVRSMLTRNAEEGEGYTGYKTTIGQDSRYAFSAAQKAMSGPDLGAMVIGELLKAHNEETGEEAKACIITVPAKFEHSACDGTREAAKKAGLLYSPLLQEPIAAALAYGFSTTEERAQWMVFDLGGGTLDISLVVVRKGEMEVPAGGHGGDDRLGGRNFDRKLMEYAMEKLKSQYQLENFSQGNAKYRSAWGRLLMQVEVAKIELSTKESAIIRMEGALCKDDRGEDVHIDIPVSRVDYERMISAEIEKVVHLCESVLSRNQLSPSDIDRLILVGGPSRTPYIQQTLKERLNIPLDSSVDPMTAVVQGAVLYGNMHEVPEEIAKKIQTAHTSVGDVEIKIEYERRSKISSYCVVGKVVGQGVDLTDVTVEFSRSDGLWTSGAIPVNERGMFTTDLMLIDNGERTLSRFKAVARDANGKELASADEPEIWYPYMGTDDALKLANSLCVAIEKNKIAVLVGEGSKLPARGFEIFKTTGLIRKGSDEDVLNIPILESVTNLFGHEEEYADCSVLIGTLVIHGSDERISRDIPENTSIELTIYEDESRDVRAVAYIPLLDEEFTDEITSGSFDVTAAQVRETFEAVKIGLQAIENLQREYPIDSVDVALGKIAKMDIKHDIEMQLENADRGEEVALSRAYKRTLELKGGLNHIAVLQLEAEVRRYLDNLRVKATGKDANDIAEMSREFDQALRANDISAQQKIKESLDDLDWQIRRRPIYKLHRLWMAFPEKFQGAPAMIRAFEEMQDLLKEISSHEEAGHHITDDQIRRAEESHERVLDLWSSELPSWLENQPASSPDTARGPIVLRK